MSTTKPRRCACCGHEITRSQFLFWHEACFQTLLHWARRGVILRRIYIPADIVRAFESASCTVLLINGRN